MRSVPPNGKLPELVCEFVFGVGGRGLVAVRGPERGPRQNLRFVLRPPRLEILRSGGPGGGVFSEIFAFPAPPEMVIFIVTK